MKVKLLLALALAAGCVWWRMGIPSGWRARASQAEPGDLRRIAGHYAALTNCAIRFRQRSLLIGALEGEIRRAPGGVFSVEWRDHQNFIGNFTNRIFSEGRGAVWWRSESNRVECASLTSTLETAAGVSRGVTAFLPLLLLGCDPLGPPEAWKPCLQKERGRGERALARDRGATRLVIVYDAETFRIKRIWTRVQGALGFLSAETLYAED